MKLYHGSIHIVKHPVIAKGRTSTDFGKGFYTTTNFQQAKKWALSKQKTAGGNAKAIVSIYEADDRILNNPHYQIKSFGAPDKEWLSFVVDCRKSVVHPYDIVFGAVADDKIYATITLFEAGVLSVEATIAQLKVNEVFNQISFHSDKSVGELTYIESAIVTEDSVEP